MRFEADFFIDGLLWYAAFVFSTTLHEASHAYTALRLGDPTAYVGGQVTLDPRPHMRRERVGMIIVPLLSYIAGGWMIGWASVPYDFDWALRHPRRHAWMSLAGPAANLVLVIVAALAIRAGMAAGVFAAPEAITFSHVTDAVGGGIVAPLATFLSILFSLNLLLCLFNLLPVPPLDGSAVVPLFTAEDRAREIMILMRSPAFSLIGLLISWNVFGYIFSPVHLRFINLLYPELRYE